MRLSSRLFFAFACACSLLTASVGQAEFLYNLEVKTLEGKKQSFGDYQGKVLLVVNTASKCGFTPQYKDLQALYEKYSAKGFVVLGFPSNDFMEQEPGTDQEIKTFCQLRYGVNFPLFGKGSVSGANMQPVYKTLLESAPEDMRGPVEWNFEKILVDKKGAVRARFGSVVNPMNARVTKQIDSLLAE